ncbi:MAG: amidase [Alphaproteobacteria bacterium]|nr:amidase [Alphaproteobacteria bacterium]
MTPDEYARLDGLALADLVRRGQVTPSELVEIAIGAVEALNPRLNAVVIQAFDQARARAREPLTGPFAGVPFLAKDLGLEWQGLPVRQGARYFQGYVPARDAELAARWRKAGAVPVGRTNSPEFGLSVATEPKIHGIARNPWDLERTPGGSTGGGAAAVAARIVPIAHANDGGGSIRIPASHSNLFGLKVTRGRTPVGPAFGELWNGHAVNHALTRTVRDSAALLDATAGPSPGDPYAAPEKPPSYLAEIATPPKALRIAANWTAPKSYGVDPEVAAAVQEAAKLLAELGHRVEEARPLYDHQALEEGHTLVVAGNIAADIVECTAFLGRSPKPDDLEPETWDLIRFGETLSANTFERARRSLHRQGRLLGAFFETCDVYLSPVVPVPPSRHGETTVERIGHFICFTCPWNATGQPACSVPFGWTKDGLPIGIQLVGRFGDEATLLKLAAQIEAARQWVERRPAISL